MSIVQQSSGTFTGSSFTVALPAASSASNLVVIVVAANITITTPAGFTLRTSQVNFMGHYLLDAAGGGTSYAITCSAGAGTWWAVEVKAGAYSSALSANDTTDALTYFTPAITPAAGLKLMLASIGSLTSATVIRTVSGWTNSFVEQVDVCQPTADYPMQGGAALESTVDGATAYSTTTTFSASSTGRSAIISAYVTTAGGGTAALPKRPRMVLQATNRAGTY